MGVILFPVFLGGLTITILSLLKLIRLIKNDQLKWRTTLIGMAISIIIYSGIVYSFSFEKTVSVFLPFLRIMFWWFYIPGAFGLILYQFKNEQVKKIANAIFVSIVFSGVLSIVLYNFVFGIPRLKC